MNKFIIYGLRDPRTGEIRYVGKSSYGINRAYQHSRPGDLDKDPTYKGKWLRKLRKLGLRAEAVVLQCCEQHELDNAERS